jgi:type IV pilus assembly protein PilA
MIVVAIIGILASIAIPAYQTYIANAAYVEVTSAMTPFKIAVDTNFQSGETLANMTAITNGGAVIGVHLRLLQQRLAVATLGIITATPNTYKGIAALDTCVMTPTVEGTALAQRLVWAYSGACLTKGYVKN